MKKLIFLITLLIAFASVDAQKTIRYQLINDDTLTNADTISAIYPGIISDAYYYSVQVVCDSLTGNPGGVAYLQQGNHTTPEKWTNISGKTVTLNGAGTYAGLLTGGTTPFLGTKIRLYILGTGTATVGCNAYLVLKPVK